MYKKYPLRQGIAPVELMMVLPLMVAFLVLIFFIGKVMLFRLTQSNVIRQVTWSVRDWDNTPLANVRPLTFVPNDGKAGVQGKLDIDEREKSSVITTDLFFDKWKIKAVTEHTLYTDTWDYKTHKRNHVNTQGRRNNIGEPASSEMPGKNARIFFFQQGYNGTKYVNSECNSCDVPALYITNLHYYEPKEPSVTPVINKPF